MKKTFKIYFYSYGSLKYFNRPQNNFFTYQEAETFLIDENNQYLFDKYVEYTILTIFNRE